MAQPIVLSGKLIAFATQACVLGSLGIALGPRRQHQGAQRSDIVGKGRGRCHHPIIAPRQRPGRSQP